MQLTINWRDLDDQTLQNLLKEIVTRDGTDYGATERTTEEKTLEAQNALKNRVAILCWDTETETSSLRPINDIDPETILDWSNESSDD
jgi:uncharacterized protein